MGKTTQQTSQSSSPPPQVLQNYQDLVNRATGVSNTPYQQYPGQIVAPSTQDQLASYENLSNLYGQATPYINQAAQYTQNAATPIQTTQGAIQPYQNPFATAGANAATTAGQGIANYGTNAANGMAGLAQNVATQGPQLQQFSSAAIDQYMNPYTQNVIDRTMANINRQNGIQQNDLASRGIMGGNAFGGDRLGVTSAELARNQDMSRDSIIANLLSSGYGQAVSQFNTGNQQALAGQQTALQGLGSAGQLGVGAQQAGGNLGLAGQNLGAQGFQNATQNAFQTQQANAQNNLAAGSQYANLGNQALGSQLTAANAQLQSGSLQQQQAQNQINAQYQQWLQQQAYPFQTTQFLGNLVMGTGNASGQNTTTTSPGPNVGSQILGLGAMGLGAFLSDERAKENIEPVGKMFDGQSIYRFNYKGEPRTQMGLIAQDVERSHPYAVSEHGGMKMVDYAAATEKAAEKGKFAGGGTVPNLASGAPGLFQPIDFTQGGVRGYVPDSQMPQTRPLQTPALPKPADNSMAPGMGTAAMAIGKGLAGMGGATGGLGATSAMGDPTGLGGLYANGGFVPPYSNGMIPRLAFGGGFSDLTFRPDRDGVYTDDLVYRPGTDPARFMPASDVFGDENRAAGYDLLRKGFGVQSPGSIPGGEPAPEPFRLDPGAMQKWRNGVDADAARGMTAPEPSAPTAFAQAAPLPQARPAGLGAPPLPPQITGPAPQPETALAYDQPRGLAPPGAAPPAPQMPPQGAPQGAIPPSIGQALMAAGAGMMASRNPTLLGGIGEGSALGIANYSAQQKAYNELDAHPVVDHSGPTTRIYYPSTKQWIDTGIPTISAAQKAANELQKSESARTQGNADRSYKLLERAQDRLEAKDESPTGYRKNRDGNLEVIPGGPADPAKIKADADAKRGTAGLLDDDTIKDMAGQYLEGDKSVMQNLGRGAQGSENIVKLRAEIGRQAREAGMTPREVATKMADFAGRTAAMRTLGTKGANVEYAANTANKAIDLADEAYAKLPRGQFVPFNQLREMYDKKTSSPEQAAAYAAVNTLVTEYARVASGGSSQATEGMRHHAREMLNTAMGPDAFKAVLNMMRREIQTAKAAYTETRKEFLANGHGGEGPSSAAAPGATAPAAAATGAKPTIKTKAEYDALKSGTEFIGSDGKPYKKP